jgi:hypothetical protein
MIWNMELAKPFIRLMHSLVTMKCPANQIEIKQQPRISNSRPYLPFHCAVSLLHIHQLFAENAASKFFHSLQSMSVSIRYRWA